MPSLWARSYFIFTAGNVTVKVKVLSTKEQIRLLEQSSSDYIKLINTLVSEMVEVKKSTKKNTKDIEVNLPSVVKNQAIKDTKSVFSTKVKKSKYKIVLILKRPVCVWNNQNYSFDFTHILISFVGEEGRNLSSFLFHVKFEGDLRGKKVDMY